MKLKLLILLWPLVSLAKVDPAKNPIYAQIVTNKPSINKDYALKLSNLIHKYSKLYNFDSNIFTAILAQESMYRLEAKACTKGLRLLSLEEVHFFNSLCESYLEESRIDDYNKCLKGIEDVAVDKVCQDFGIGQVNYKTARTYRFEVSRLTTDLEYSIKASGKVFADISKMYKNKEPQDYYTRYNASNKAKRLIYKNKIKKYLRGNK
jgi:hypothetical protein